MFTHAPRCLFLFLLFVEKEKQNTPRPKMRKIIFCPSNNYFPQDMCIWSNSIRIFCSIWLSSMKSFFCIWSNSISLVELDEDFFCVWSNSIKIFVPFGRTLSRFSTLTLAPPLPPIPSPPRSRSPSFSWLFTSLCPSFCRGSAV